ncbi:MAG: hypothetical protein F7C35_08260 [Desulfurococcales archaeon]|nr:hypothetical protein [Desulfurococcales archaeon]
MPRKARTVRPRGDVDMIRGLVDSRIAAWVRSVAGLLRVEHGDLVEPGLRLVKVIVDAGEVPPELAKLLKEKDPLALEELETLLAYAKEIVAGVTG